MIIIYFGALLIRSIFSKIVLALILVKKIKFLDFKRRLMDVLSQIG